MLPTPEKFQEVEFRKEKTTILTQDEVLVGIISDTQTTEKVQDLPKEIENVFKNVNLIIHAGDVDHPEFIKRLENIAPVYAVKGNMDYGELKEELPAGLLVKIYKWKIGVVHSPVSFWIGSHFNQVQEVIAEKLAQKEDFDILIFGHTHHPYLKEINSGKKKILLFNPGSAMSPYVFSDKISVGILRLSKNYFKGEIINLKT
jgi:hypothetical protein